MTAEIPESVWGRRLRRSFGILDVVTNQTAHAAITAKLIPLGPTQEQLPTFGVTGHLGLMV